MPGASIIWQADSTMDGRQSPPETRASTDHWLRGGKASSKGSSAGEPIYLMYQCPASDALRRLISKPGNGAGSRRYPTSALNPNRGAAANINSLPANTRYPMLFSDGGT